MTSVPARRGRFAVGAAEVVLAGLLALLVGRELLVLDAARSSYLDRAAVSDDAHAVERDGWASGRSQRVAVARVCVVAGQGLLLVGLAASAVAGAPSDRWAWGALLAWCLLLLFGGGAELPQRLR